MTRRPENAAAVESDAPGVAASDAVSPDQAPSVAGSETMPNLRPPAGTGAGPADELRRFEALCDEFERAWRTESVPPIEDFLARSPPALEERLFRALLQLELEYRSDRGEETAADDYRPRFPRYGSMIDDVFRGSDVLLAAGDMTAVAPKRFGEYELGRVLGRGGMGVVYEAYHLRLKRRVAVKMLSKQRFDDSESVARFEQEMAAIGRLSHPNIVAAYDAGEFEGTHYLVMEYVDGVNLAALVERLGPLAIADACELARQTAVALEYARSNGLVHRDIKPSNLMLAAGDVVKVLDMGLARLRSGADDESEKPEGLTQTGQIVGTLDYLAPEQVDDCKGVDIRADIYSLGVTLYVLLTGRLPLPSEGLTLSRRLLALADVKPTPIENYRADVPLELRTVVHRCLAKRPDDRFTTPAELAANLAKFVAGCDLGGLRGERSPAENRAPSSTAALKSTESFADKFRPYRRRVAVACAIVGVAVAAAAYAVTRPGDAVIDPPLKPPLLSVHQQNQLLVHLQRDGRIFHDESFLTVLPAKMGDDIWLIVDAPEGLDVELWAIDGQGAIHEFTGGVFDSNRLEGRRFVYPADGLALPLDDRPGTEVMLAAARPKGSTWLRPIRDRLLAATAGQPLPTGVPDRTVVCANLEKEFVRSADDLVGRGFGQPHARAFSGLEAVRERVASLRRELSQEPELKLLSITAFPHEKK